MGGDHEGSIRFLQTWLKQKGANYSRYYRALAYIQLGDACKKKGDADKASRAFLEASQLLEEQADLESGVVKDVQLTNAIRLESMGILESHEALIEGGFELCTFAQGNEPTLQHNATLSRSYSSFSPNGCLAICSGDLSRGQRLCQPGIVCLCRLVLE